MYFGSGEATFSSFVMYRPKVGQYEMHLKSALGQVVPPLQINVVEGIPCVPRANGVSCWDAIDFKENWLPWRSSIKHSTA